MLLGVVLQLREMIPTLQTHPLSITPLCEKSSRLCILKCLEPRFIVLIRCARCEVITNVKRLSIRG
jgi:hypothetical protein